MKTETYIIGENGVPK